MSQVNKQMQSSVTRRHDLTWSIRLTRFFLVPLGSQEKILSVVVQVAKVVDTCTCMMRMFLCDQVGDALGAKVACVRRFQGTLTRKDM